MATIITCFPEGILASDLGFVQFVLLYGKRGREYQFSSLVFLGGFCTNKWRDLRVEPLLLGALEPLPLCGTFELPRNASFACYQHHYG